MKIFILAGGSGTRLWPMSRKDYPKQFLKINSDKSFLEQTVARLSGLVSLKDVIFLTNGKHQSHLKSCIPAAHVVLEPVSKNTAPAIALGIKYCLEKFGCGLDEVVCVLPSDQVVKPDNVFRKYLRSAEKIAKEGYIVTFGVKPSKPETGYGYIKVTKSQVTSHKYFEVKRFVEKPDEETAQKYIESGDYYWNSGIFAFSIRTIVEELERCSPKIGKLLENNFEDILNKFDEMPSISIDYAVMEKSKRVVIIPMDLFWSDVGSWDSVFELLKKDKSGNAKIGNIVSADTKDSLIIGDRRLIVTIGLEDCIIVDTADALLVTRKGYSQRVKDIVQGML